MHKEYFLGLYEKAMPVDLSWSEKFAIASDCGFDGIEISIDETDEKLARLSRITQECAEIRDACLQSGLVMKTMCLSGHRKYPLGSRETSVRNQSLAIMQKAIDFACSCGIRIIQLAGYDVFYEEHDETTEKLFLNNLRKSVDMAAAFGITLGFETMETPFMDTVAKAVAVTESIQSPWLGIYPDIGNLTNAAILYGNDVTDDINLGKGKIFAAHLKETQPGTYRNMCFGSSATMEYTRCIRALWAQGVRLFTGEFWYLGGSDYRADIASASQFLRNKIETAQH